MQWLQYILNPPVTVSLNETAKIMLPITGTLLGLVFVASIYWLQSGFSRLEYTTTLIEDYFIANIKVLLDLLIGTSLVALFAILEIHLLIVLSFWFFGIIFLIDLLKVTAQRDYIATTFYLKYIPSKHGKIRLFSDKVFNYVAGWIFLIFGYGTCVVYPIIVSQKTTGLPALSEKSLIIFMFVSTALVLSQVKFLLTQAFKIRKDIERMMQTENEKKATLLDEKPIVWSTEKRNIEIMIIEERLKSIEVIQWIDNNILFQKESWNSRDLKNIPVLNYKPRVEEHGKCHLEIIIPYLQDDKHTRDFIFRWSKEILEVIAKSKTGVRQYSMSFFRNEGGAALTHFGMIRASREDVLRGLSTYYTDEEFVRGLPGKYLASAVAEF